MSIAGKERLPMKIAVVFQQRDIPNLRAEREIRTLKHAGFDTARIAFATPRFSPIGNLAWRAVEFERHVRRVADALSASTPDLIVAHDLEALPSAVRTGRKTIYDSHDDWPAVYADNSRLESWIAAVFERWLVGRVAHVVTPCEPLTRKFRDIGVAATTLYNARPSGEIVRAGPREARASFGYTDQDFVVGWAAKFQPGDGSGVLLDSLGRLPMTAKALIAGGPAHEAEMIRKEARDRGIGDRVEVLGYVPYEKMGPVYAAMDVGVILLDRRKNFYNALPNRLFDYMAHGVPVLVPAYPAMSEVVQDARCGVTVEQSDVENVSSAVRDLMARRSEIASLGARGRDAFESVYCWERQETAFLRVVDDAAKGPP